MFGNGQSFDYRLRISAAITVPLCLLVSACGGDGAPVASLPPFPVTPAPIPTPAASPTGVEVQKSWLNSPATRPGTFDLIGTLTTTPGNGGASTSRAVVPGEFTMTSQSTGGAYSYQLNAPTGLLPGELSKFGPDQFDASWDFNPGGINVYYFNRSGQVVQHFGETLREYTIGSDGAQKTLEDNPYSRAFSSVYQWLGTDRQLKTSFDYDLGYSYVAMGEWSWQVVDIDGAAAGASGNLLFAEGDRTPASGIPVSGTATYDARTLTLMSRSLSPGIPFSLTADFLQRTISTQIKQDYFYDPDPNDSDSPPILGIHVSGTAPFSNTGMFDIPLSGTVNYTTVNSSAMPSAQAVTGDMNGAFFGPHAEQVGGTFSLQNSGGATLLQDAFVGKQH